MNKEKINSIIFIILYITITYTGFTFGLISKYDNNESENRTSYKVNNLLNINLLNNEENKNNLEIAVADQIPFTSIIKKVNNFISNYTSIKITKTFTKNKCKNNYITLSKGIITYGCEDNLVYKPTDYKSSKEDIDERINDINKVIENTNIPVYVYYIEKDTDIYFDTNKKTDIYKTLKEKINTDKINRFETNNFNEFKENFYKTDHHWNYKGSYKAYNELTEFLNLEEKIEIKNKECSNKTLTGSKANVSGGTKIFSEKFCVFNYDIKEYDTYINKNKVSNYGLNSVKELNEVGYAAYYGNDEAEILFDYHNNDKKNILIVGESYDNAILKLLSTHYNKTYSIDLRHYERIFNNKFDYKNYIKENEIDEILLIGNIDFFRSKEFNLEV